MAVEIPVIIDIDGAFQEAASRVQSAMQPLQKAVDKNVVNIRVDNSSIKENNEELEKLNAWYRRLESAEWSRIGEKLDLGPTINRAILELQRLEKEINEIQELRWSEGGRGDFSFAEEYNNLRQQIQKAKQEVIALEQTQKKMSNAVGINTAEHIENLSKTNFELLQMRDYYQRLEASSEKWAKAVNPEVLRHIDGLTRVNFELLQMQEYYKRIEEESMRLSDSVNGYQSRIAELNERWNSMTKAERESAKGQEIRKKYEEEIKALETEAQTLGQIHQKEVERVQEAKRAAEERIRLAKKEAEERRKIAEKEAEERRKAAEKAAEEERKEQERIDKLRQKGIQSRRYENAILNTTAKTRRVLQEQERILSDRLSRARIGSSTYNKLKTDLEGVRKELSAINGETVETESRLGRLVKNSLRLVALHAAGTFIRNVREVTAEFELQRVALGSIIQDTERAEGLFRQIKAAAIESPFEIKDLVSYTKQLSAYQIETDKLFDTTMKLADVSAGLGVDMSRLVLAYGQVRAAAVLRGQELRQFTEAGIPLVDKLAEKFRELGREGTTTADVFQLISERAVPFRMIEEIFDDMTSAGGMFYKMQEKQAKTLAGQWSNLKDAISIMYDEIGNTEVVHNAMEDLISGARSVMQNWREYASAIGSVSSAMLTYVAVAKGVEIWTNLVAKAEKLAKLAETDREKSMRRFVTSIIGKTAAEKVSTVATNLHTAALNRAAAANTTLAATFWNLTAAMLSNPFGILAVAVGGVIALVSSLSKKAHDVSESIDNAEASIARFNKTTGDTAKLIDQYEELSKKEKLTAQEAAKLRDISRELGNIFPKTTEGINQQTGALTLNIEKLKQYNLEAEKAIRKGMQAQISENKKLIKDNQNEIDRLTKENTRGWGRNKKLGLLSPVLFPLTKAQMAENASKLVKLQDDNEKLAKTNRELQDTLDGVKKSTGEAAKETTKWQDKLIEFNTRIAKDGVTSLQIVSPDQIKNYSKLSDALEDIAKKYKEYAEQEKSMKAAIEGKSGAERAELQGILDRTTARKNLAKEELDYYNAFYLTEKKSGHSDRLRKLHSEISELTNAYKKYLELRKYKTQADALADINTLFPQLAGWAPTYQNVLAKLGTLQTKYKGDTEATRLINQALSNIKFDALKTELQKKIAQISDDLKRSETIRNFYKDIFDATGDQQIATNLTMSVYGDLGKDFRDRIQKSMIDSINSIPADELSDAARLGFLGDITVFDVDNIKRNLDLLPPEVKKLFEELLKQNEEYNAQWEKDFIKRYQKTKTYAERIATLENQRKTALEDAEKRGKSPEQQAAVTAYWNKQIANVQLEALKDTYTWTKAFEDLEGVSSDTLQNLIKLIDEYITKYAKDLEPEQLKELTRAKERAKQQYVERDAIKSARKAFDDLTKARGRSFSLLLKGQKGTEDYARAMDDAMEAAKRFAQAVEQLESDINSLISTSKDLFSTFASDKDAQYFSEQMENLSKAIGGGAKVAIGAARIGAGDVTGVMQLISGLGDVVSGIGGGVNSANLHRLNEQIEDQTHLIENLEYAYSRLETAMADSFGSDYVYNYQQQLANLEAVQAAYEEQARLEREKGKKADEEKIREYERAATETANKIKEKQSELAEFFTGTDLTSAAKDFASAWIEAYKQFGSTTDAMKEKFHDMIESMVTQSLAAKMVQEILDPLFREINTMANDAEGLTATDIAEIARKAPEYYAQIDAALTQLMGQLGAAGLNIRDNVGSFTGISRNIANASEESINGLAAGINTQNFYMQHIDMNVAAILATLTGGASSAGASQSGEYVDPYKDQMLLYAGHIPTIDQNLASLLSEVRKVVKPRGTTATHYVAVNM